jgi:hypothetical protein
MHPSRHPQRRAHLLFSAALTLSLTLPVRAIETLPSPSATIVSSNAGTTVFNGVNINQLVGAETFYNHGYDGRRAVVANVEAGHVWNGHETLAHVSTYLNDPSIDLPAGRQYDWHATMVGQIINGRGILYGLELDTFKFAAYYGIAPGATLWSTAIASQWNPDPEGEFTGSFEITPASLIYGYQKPMADGVAGRRADVVNSSWGFEDPAGADDITKLTDALAYANHTTVIFAAGNHDTGTAKVGGPASGFNSIAVGSLSSDTSAPVYGGVSDFSNTGPNDFYNPQTNVTIANVRSRIDIAAPGDNLTVAFYGGVTGGHTSGADPTAGAGQYYIRDMAGTSFASPIVASGASLLVDVGYDKFAGDKSIDARVIKAVLLNSAAKPIDWDNGQALAQGVVTTTQSLDLNTGAGALDLDRAYKQYTLGTTDVPGLAGSTSIAERGWDFATVSPGAPNDYHFTSPLLGGTTLTATVDWFAVRSFDPATTDVADVQFTDLDLQVFESISPGVDQLIAESASTYNNTEHLSFLLPSNGMYFLRIVHAGEIYDMTGLTPDATDYGLAWWGTPVPEPSSTLFLALLLATLLTHRRRRQRHV